MNIRPDRNQSIAVQQARCQNRRPPRRAAANLLKKWPVGSCVDRYHVRVWFIIIVDPAGINHIRIRIVRHWTVRSIVDTIELIIGLMHEYTTTDHRTSIVRCCPKLNTLIHPDSCAGSGEACIEEQHEHVSSRKGT